MNKREVLEKLVDNYIKHALAGNPKHWKKGTNDITIALTALDKLEKEKIRGLEKALKNMVEWYGGLADDASIGKSAKLAVINAKQVLEKGKL